MKHLASNDSNCPRKDNNNPMGKKATAKHGPQTPAKAITRKPKPSKGLSPNNPNTIASPTDQITLPPQSGKKSNQKQINEGFDCLNSTRGYESWLTDDVVDWALNLLVDKETTTVVFPALWVDLVINKTPLDNMKKMILEREYTIFPICKDYHWSLVVFRKKGNSPPKAGYIDPFQRPTPRDVENMLGKMGVRIIPTDYEGRGFQKQEDSYSCGLWILKYTAMILNLEHIKDMSTAEIRKWLKQGKEKQERETTQVRRDREEEATPKAEIVVKKKAPEETRTGRQEKADNSTGEGRQVKQVAKKATPASQLVQVPESILSEQPSPQTRDTESVLVPDEEPLTVVQVSETETRLNLYYPAPRYYACVECFTSFSNVNDQGTDDDKEIKVRKWIVCHLKRHNLVPRIFLTCRICKDFQVERAPHAMGCVQCHQAITKHLRTHPEEIIKAPPVGDFVCGKCWIPFKSARHLEHHSKACKEKKQMPHRAAEQPPPAVPVKSNDPPAPEPIQKSTETETASPIVPHNNIPRAFQPLFLSRGPKSWYTEELTVWALNQITGYQVIPPALWADIQGGSDPLLTLEDVIRDKPVTLLPLCDGKQWAIILIQREATGISAIYLDPTQPSAIPERLRDRLTNVLKVKLITPIRIYDRVPKQEADEWADSGPWICILATVIVQLLGKSSKIRVPTTEQIRAKLRLEYQLEQEELEAIGATGQTEEPLIPVNARQALPQLMELRIDNPFAQTSPAPEKPKIDQNLVDKVQTWLADIVPHYYDGGCPFNQLEWVIQQATASIGAITRNNPALLDATLKKTVPPPQLPGETATQTATKPKKRPTPPQLDTSSTERISWSYIKNPKKTEKKTGKKEQQPRYRGSTCSQSKISLIYKAGDPKDPGNWRPIAFLATVYKLYSSLLNARIGTVDGLVSTHQKGFQKGSGTVFLDLKNAFGSVPHQLIQEAMEAFGFPGELLEIVEDIYNGSSTQVASSHELTDPIPLHAGIKQGDPLSPALFNMAIEPLLRRHVEHSNGYPLLGTNISYLAYADDLVLLNQHKNSLQEDLNRMAEAAAQMNLEFKPSKCGSLVITQGNTHNNGALLIKGTELPRLDSNNYYKYLGIPTGFRRYFTIEKTAKEMEDATAVIVNSNLEPRLKLNAIAIFVLPKIHYLLQHGNPCSNDVKAISSQMTRAIRTCVCLPDCSPIEYLYSPTKKGCLGFTMIMDLMRIYAFSTFMCNLWSTDKLLSQLTVRHFEEQMRLLTGDPDLEGETMCSRSEVYPHGSRHYCKIRRNTGQSYTQGILEKLYMEINQGQIQLVVKIVGSEKETTLTAAQNELQQSWRIQSKKQRTGDESEKIHKSQQPFKWLRRTSSADGSSLQGRCT